MLINIANNLAMLSIRPEKTNGAQADATGKQVTVQTPVLRRRCQGHFKRQPAETRLQQYRENGRLK